MWAVLQPAEARKTMKSVFLILMTVRRAVKIEAVRKVCTAPASEPMRNFHAKLRLAR